MVDIRPVILNTKIFYPPCTAGHPGGHSDLDDLLNEVGYPSLIYPQLGSDPFHGDRPTHIGNQSDCFVDFGLDRLDYGFTHAKGLPSITANRH
ncbi:hypothetical protein AYI68_g672 [Smittium mucronatum]|uniref:Uncharacterized protein n=1 Tax=Smittium mucronatum TaxID=133383 RepID=A0A1R0H7F5_9FUNG|nr:hypothetical protein AYI68_g672 [Smittium mucronatum]